MNLQDITTKAWILALFKRDDGERFLLGDGYYDFKESLQHFSANSIANDIVELQGADGQLLAGQVKRATTQSFDGFIGDGLTSKAEVEFRRRAFLQFFQVRHFYDVIYVFCDGTAIIRKRGFLVDAPEVPEIRQMSPSYHVALNFEDANYYEYAEDGLGDEVFAHTVKVAFSNAITGGLVWDEDGAVSNNFQIIYSDQISASGNPISFSIDTEYGGKIEELKLNGNATQQTYSGKNLASLETTGSVIGGVSFSIVDGIIHLSGTTETNKNFFFDSFRTNSGSAMFWIEVTGYTVPESGNASFILQSSSDNSTWSNFKELSFRTLTPSEQITLDSTKYYRLRWYVNDNTFTNATIKVQLEYGSAKTSFEQYVGGTASPNPDYPQEAKTVTGEQVVTVTGKNLFDKDNSDTANGYLSSSNGAFVTGGGSYATKNATFLPAGDYVASQMLEKVCHYALDGSYIGLITRTGSRTEKFTMPSVGYVRLQFPSSFDANTFQLEHGSTATTYEPYQSQSYEINLGKNLLDPSTFDQRVFENDLTNNYYYDANLHFALKAGETYTLSAYVEQVESTPYKFSALIGTANAATAELGTVQNLTTVGGRISVTFSVSEAQITSAGGNNLFMRLPRYASPTTTHYKIKDIQLELGSQASSYSAYITPIELAKIGTYQDYIWNDGGTWKVHKEIGKGTVTLGDTVYDLFGGTLKGSTYEPSNKNQTWQQEIRALCDKATNSTTYPNAQKWAGSFYENPANFMFIGTATDTSVTLKAKYDGATLYYLLATPTDTAITEQSLIDQLNAVANAQLYSGQNNIMNLAFSPNLAGDLEIGYVEMEGYDRDQIIIDSQNQTVTMNGENIYDKIADGSEFITMASGDNKMFLTSEVTSDTGYAEVKFKQGFISI